MHRCQRLHDPHTVAVLVSPQAACPGNLGIVLASAVNQDGRSSGLTVPNGPAQTVLLADVMHAAGALPSTLRYVALHGTGTSVGDPIEVGALGQALLRRIEGRAVAYAAEVSMALGSPKSCYGHTEGAAGLTGDSQMTVFWFLFLTLFRRQANCYGTFRS